MVNVADGAAALARPVQGPPRWLRLHVADAATWRLLFLLLLLPLLLLASLVRGLGGASSQMTGRRHGPLSHRGAQELQLIENRSTGRPRHQIRSPIARSLTTVLRLAKQISQRRLSSFVVGYAIAGYGYCSVMMWCEADQGADSTRLRRPPVCEACGLCLCL